MFLTERTLTGIPRLDELLHGGIPRGKVVLVAGEPGTGKTIFCSQFIVNGVRQHGENGVIFTLDEARTSLYREMQQFGWGLEDLEKEVKLKTSCKSRMIIIERAAVTTVKRLTA